MRPSKPRDLHSLREEEEKGEEREEGDNGDGLYRLNDISLHCILGREKVSTGLNTVGRVSGSDLPNLVITC